MSPVSCVVDVHSWPLADNRANRLVVARRPSASVDEVAAPARGMMWETCRLANTQSRADGVSGVPAFAATLAAAGCAPGGTSKFETRVSGTVMLAWIATKL